MKVLAEKVAPRHLVAVDESYVSLCTPIKKVVALRGGSVPEMLINDRYQGVTLIGALFGTGELLVWICSGSINEEVFVRFLYRIKRRHGKVAVHVILDNASYHVRRRVKAIAQNKGIKLHYQPPYSPFLNAAEEIWRQLKEWLRCRFFTTVEALKKAIEAFLQCHRKLNVRLVNYFS